MKSKLFLICDIAHGIKAGLESGEGAPWPEESTFSEFHFIPTPLKNV